MNYRFLDWDSEFFGLKVARIITPSLNEKELAEVLSTLSGEGTGLAYWPSMREIGQGPLSRFHGLLADVKVTFAADLEPLRTEDFSGLDSVESLVGTPSTEDLEKLALQSGEFSRFALDPRFPRERFESLYLLWLRRSLAGELAQEVLGIRVGYRVVGMVTLGVKDGRGDIGLIAVNREYRGRKLGEKLVRASQRWFRRRGFETAQVVTQGLNAPACNLYRKCGYEIERTEYFYHFWLGADE